jgi:hypothetical protein
VIFKLLLFCLNCVAREAIPQAIVKTSTTTSVMYMSIWNDMLNTRQRSHIMQNKYMLVMWYSSQSKFLNVGSCERVVKSTHVMLLIASILYFDEDTYIVVQSKI